MGKEKITNANSFPKDWPIKKLADIGSTYGGLTNKSKEDFAEGNSKFITYKNIYNNTFINTNELESVRIYKDEKQNKVKYGDVFFTGSSETPDEVGISSVLLEEVDDVYLNSFCFGFRFNDLKKTIPEFYGYYFRGPVFRNEVYPLAQGSTRF
ncbi:restriction endonuclease subunit S, partial [Anoxybacillus flavithermus]|uniref:restriction endonuclease subunit S n=2 Tax=Anoxybacillus TaxID=150247 RepID=UPI0019D552CF